MKKKQDRQVKNILVGKIGCRGMDITITPNNADVTLREVFWDTETGKISYIVQMCIMSEFVPQILRILRENGFDAAKEPM